MEPGPADQCPTLQNVAQQFVCWRTNRKKHERIPAHLWQAAARLCATHPISRVCKQLGISFSDLKKRISPKTPPVRFVELELNNPAQMWHLECQRPDGARLRLSANGPMPAIEQLLGHFLP